MSASRSSGARAGGSVVTPASIGGAELPHFWHVTNPTATRAAAAATACHLSHFTGAIYHQPSSEAPLSEPRGSARSLLSPARAFVELVGREDRDRIAPLGSSPEVGPRTDGKPLAPVDRQATTRSQRQNTRDKEEEAGSQPGGKPRPERRNAAVPRPGPRPGDLARRQPRETKRGGRENRERRLFLSARSSG